MPHSPALRTPHAGEPLRRRGVASSSPASLLVLPLALVIGTTLLLTGCDKHRSNGFHRSSRGSASPFRLDSKPKKQKQFGIGSSGSHPNGLRVQGSEF